MTAEQKLHSLLCKSMDGDQDNYRLFLIECSKIIEKRVRYKIFLKIDHDEVSQEILFGIHKSLASFNKDKKALPWLNSIINYKIIDYFRRNSSNLEFSDIDDVTNEALSANTYIEGIELFEQLTDDCQECLKLTKFDGLTSQQAAKEIGINENALRTRVSRCTKSFVKIYEESMYE